MAIYGGILGWDTDRCNALRVSYPLPYFPRLLFPPNGVEAITLTSSAS